MPVVGSSSSSRPFTGNDKCMLLQYCGLRVQRWRVAGRWLPRQAWSWSCLGPDFLSRTAVPSLICGVASKLPRTARRCRGGQGKCPSCGNPQWPLPGCSVRICFEKGVSVAEVLADQSLACRGGCAVRLGVTRKGWQFRPGKWSQARVGKRRESGLFPESDATTAIEWGFEVAEACVVMVAMIILCAAGRSLLY